MYTIDFEGFCCIIIGSSVVTNVLLFFQSSGGDCMCVGAGNIWEPSVLSAQFFWVPKTPLENKVYLLK